MSNIVGIHSFRLPGVFMENPYSDSVNGPLWSLNPEILCYILVPILYRKNSTQKRGWILFAMVLCGALYELSNHGLINIVNKNWLIVMMCFWFGVSINYYQLEKYLNMQIAVVLGMVAAFFPIDIIVIKIIIICYGVLSLCLIEKPIYRNLIKYDINYEIYLYAWPIQQTLIYYLISDTNICIPVTWMFCLSFLCVLGISIIMNRLCLKLKRKKIYGAI